MEKMFAQARQELTDEHVREKNKMIDSFEEQKAALKDRLCTEKKYARYGIAF